MIINKAVSSRDLKNITHVADLVIVGGGLSGICCAITAARTGCNVILVQDRPVLGGNSSSEVRLWVLGATSHMGNNNRWSREGGVIDELLVENLHRNPEGNPLIFDVILLDKVKSELNITLLLNTSVYEVEKNADDHILSVTGFCSQNSTNYKLKAPQFCDASGDGILGFLAGAAFRMGAETQEEFGEKFAPSREYGELLGHSLYFYSKDTGKPVTFVPPAFALDDITKIPRYRNFNSSDYGCKLWWVEYGGTLDTVHDTEDIKWELWKVVYGVWNYIKNSGKFPEAKNLTLEWVGMIPGKRESRRFEGEYLLKQQDIVEQRRHDDAVAFGGWSIDLHPADGVFSEKPGCNQWHSKGVYQIPFRSLYSKNIKNLYLAGRIISATHVAFASSRVMATGAHVGQAVGMAAKIALDKGLLPADFVKTNYIKVLQQELLKAGQHIPGLVLSDEEDLVQSATITASSELELWELAESDQWIPLETSVAQLLPLKAGKIPNTVIHARAQVKTTLEVQLRISSKQGNYTPDITLETQHIAINPGRNCIQLNFDRVLETDTYAFIGFMKNAEVSLSYSDQLVTGVLSVYNQINKAVSNYGKQTPPADIGVDEFEFWCPKRRPEGKNLAMKITGGIKQFGVTQVKQGLYRPTTQPNAWVADFNDTRPAVYMEWAQPQTISNIVLMFDTDYDHPMETVLMTHPERDIPYCVKNYKVLNDKGEVIYTQTGNHQTMNKIVFDKPVLTGKLAFLFDHPSAQVPAAVFGIRCY